MTGVQIGDMYHSDYLGFHFIIISSEYIEDTDKLWWKCFVPEEARFHWFMNDDFFMLDKVQ